MMLKKGYLIIALAIVSVLLGSLFYNNMTQAQKLRTFKGSVQISLMDYTVIAWLRLEEGQTYIYPFAFNPKEELSNITDFWVSFRRGVGGSTTLQYTMNGIAPVSESLPTIQFETHHTIHITNTGFHDAVKTGINYFSITLPPPTNIAYINQLTIFIEYEYQAR